MKPFPGLHNKGSIECINYHHCHAWRVVENVCGIVSVVFRVFRKPLLLEPENTELTSTHLHNFLLRSESSSAFYAPPGTFKYEDRGTGTLVPGQ